MTIGEAVRERILQLCEERNISINKLCTISGVTEVKYMGEQQLDPLLVGEIIANFRTEKGMTQEVLSGLSDIGRTHLSAIERGERKPTLETLYRISNALDIPMSTIVIAIENEIAKTKKL